MWTDLLLSSLVLVALLITFILGLVSTADVVRKNVTRDVLRPEDTAAVFFGQFFLWACVFLAFYTAGNEKHY